MQQQPIARLKNADKTLKSIIETIALPEIVSTHDVFHDLMSCILEQQIHYRSTKKVFQKMLASAGLSSLSLDNLEIFGEAVYPNAKLSISKYETISDTTAFFRAQQLLWDQLSDDEVRKSLSQIKGIGPWTQDMILLYTLGRPDVFPADDFHLKEIMVKLYALDEKSKLKAQMLEVASGWAPYRSLATKYLLGWKVWNKQGGTI